MTLDVSTTINIVLALIAVVSVVFAWRATQAAEKTNSIELIGQLYSTYQSDEMLRNLRKVWDIYRQLWIADSDTKETAVERVNKGVPIRYESALAYFKDLDLDSPEFRAIHSVINFWTYLELLLKRRALTPQEVGAFTSPRLLGFLFPMHKAYDARFDVEDEEEPVLGYACRVFGISRSEQGTSETGATE